MAERFLIRMSLQLLAAAQRVNEIGYIRAILHVDIHLASLFQQFLQQRNPPSLAIRRFCRLQRRPDRAGRSDPRVELRLLRQHGQVNRLVLPWPGAQTAWAVHCTVAAPITPK